MASFILCCLMFVGYSFFQVQDVRVQSRKLEEAKKQLVWSRVIAESFNTDIFDIPFCFLLHKVSRKIG